jgi:hypothetical protein
MAPGLKKYVESAHSAHRPFFFLPDERDDPDTGLSEDAIDRGHGAEALFIKVCK